jgi:TrmH family RNA methyltransferase
MTDFDNLRVVLVAARNPLNIGAAARAMSNFGVKRLRVVNPYERAFREARSAVGAADLLAKAEEYASVGEAVADCKLVVGTTAAGPRRELQHRLLRLEDGARLIKRQLQAAPVALLFGSERVGLSNQEMSHCHWVTRIPTREQHGSMNLGQAVAVCLYELVRGRKKTSARILAGKKEKTRPTSADVERLTQALLEVLRASGYVKPRTIAAEERSRRLLRRMELSANDAEVWLGMLRQIAWKLGVRE